jgi:ribose transport system substrate-binding protein
MKKEIHMKNKHLLTVVLGIMLVAALIGGCAAPAAAPATPAAGDATEAPAADAAADAAATEAPAEEAAADAAADGTKPYIPVISKGFQHQFWQAVEMGAEQAAVDYNVDISFEGPETEAMVDKQIEMVQAALAKNPAAICPTAATDNIAAAAAAADKMAELIGEEGEVAVIVHDQTSRTGIDRRDGFVNRIAEAYPNITVVDVQYGAGDHLKSTDLAKAIIQAHPNLKGFFGANEGSIIGVLNAVTELGMEGDMVVIGYDAGKQQKEAIRSGVQAGAISQDPVGIGYKCVEAAVKAINGEELPEVIDTGFVWYDATNIDSEEMQPLLYD